jgi:hypothetical protein
MNLAGLAYLMLQSNDQLTVCNVPSVCQFIQNNAALTSISNNDTQCNSIQQVVFKCTSSVDDPAKEPLALYPNPCSNQLWIRGVTDLFDVRVYNQLGQLIQRIDHLDTTDSIDTQLLERGWYYLHSANGAVISFSKI